MLIAAVLQQVYKEYTDGPAQAPPAEGEDQPVVKSAYQLEQEKEVLR
jgi:hypothetical protein